MCDICKQRDPSHPKKYCFHRYKHPRIRKSDFGESRENRPFFRTLREDFKYRCCYCTLHESETGTWRFFEADHFIPVHLNLGLETVYTNLFYSCQDCNRYKGADPKVLTGSYVNPCEGNLHTHHIVEVTNGWFEGRTDQGRYMVRRLQLGEDGVRIDLHRHLQARREEQLSWDHQRFIKQRIINQVDKLLSISPWPWLPEERVQWQKIRDDLEQDITAMLRSRLETLKPPPFP